MVIGDLLIQAVADSVALAVAVRSLGASSDALGGGT